MIKWVNLIIPKEKPPIERTIGGFGINAWQWSGPRQSLGSVNYLSHFYFSAVAPAFNYAAEYFNCLSISSIKLMFMYLRVPQLVAET
jgi:hypothetical protein